LKGLWLTSEFPAQISGMSPDIPFAFQEQITTTNNNHPFSHPFENRYLRTSRGSVCWRMGPFL